MNVLLVSTWGTACGIAEHSAMLKEAVEQADPSIDILPCPEALDPFTSHEIPPCDHKPWKPDVLHLNYHAALHSRWTPNIIKVWQESKGCKVLVTYHDTGVPNSDQCKQVCEAADYFVVHEPYKDLHDVVIPPMSELDRANRTPPAARRKGEYLRMGVPRPEEPYILSADREYNTTFAGWKGWSNRPVLGSVGFPFPWKNYDELARITAQCGWALLLLAPGCTLEQQARWHELNPYTKVLCEFTPREQTVQWLAGCDATAFTYTCANTGQSAAILLGIAARKPVIALETCRQFRSLLSDPLGNRAITWIDSFEELETALQQTFIQRVDPGIVALAEQESWTKVGQRYAAIYTALAEGRQP